MDIREENFELSSLGNPPEKQPIWNESSLLKRSVDSMNLIVSTNIWYLVLDVFMAYPSIDGLASARNVRSRGTRVKVPSGFPTFTANATVQS
jgi:hypothetical protein